MITLSNCILGYTVSIKTIEAYSFERGKMYAIIGKNGSGKSTLMRSLAGLIPFLNGSATLDHLNLSKISATHRSEKIAFLSAKNNIFSNKNVFYILNLFNKDLKIIEEVIELLELRPFLNKNINSLSDGQRQIVFVASQIIKNTDYLILDEPLNHLDVYKKEQLLQVLQNICRSKNKCILISIHDKYLTERYFDAVLDISELP